MQSECILWTGVTNPKGYGVSQGKLVHRTAWERANGPIPPGMFVCHHCDNPPCIRLDHLFLGTPADNARDMVIKGRHNPVHLNGETNPAAKLTEADVRAMRADFVRLIHQLATQHDVTPTLIRAILRGEVWPHLRASKRADASALGNFDPT